MNPSFKLFLILFISLEITFTSKLWANIIIILVALALLAVHHFSWRQFCWLIAIPFLPAMALFITISFFSPDRDWFYGWVLVSRIYGYVSLGTLFTATTSQLALACSLEQNCHLPSKYAYGVLAAFNLVPRIRQSINTIYMAARMRGVTLHWWSPTLYFKAILAAIQWSDQLAQAMESHGFVEGQVRSFATVITISKKDWLLLGGIILVVQFLVIALP